MERRGFNQTPTFESRFDKLASRLRKAGRGIPLRVECTDLILRSRQTETTAHIHYWIESRRALKYVRHRTTKS